MGAKGGAGGLFVRLSSISLGWGKSRSSFKLPTLLPGSSRLGAISGSFPRLPQCPLPLTAPTLAPTAHVLRKMTLPPPSPVNLVGPLIPGVALELFVLPSQVGGIPG